MEILCVTSTMKSIVGIAGGATRASITHHQAVKGNMAEISAKDGTQETVVNLIASVASIYLLNVISESWYELGFIFLMMSLHLYFNFKAVSSLIFNSLNESRAVLFIKSYCNNNNFLGPLAINKNESVILGMGVNNICGFKIKLGCSLSSIVHLYNFTEMQKILELYQAYQYVIIPDVKKRCIYIAFEKQCDTRSVLTSYFHAAMLAFATCVYNDISIDIAVKRQRKYSNTIARLMSFMNNIQRETEYHSNLTIDELKSFNKFMEQEINMFFTSLCVNGWDINMHSFYIDQWRIEWKSHSEKLK